MSRRTAVMSRTSTTTVAREAEPLLKFQFAQVAPPPLARTRTDKAASIKEALLRWLDEQL